MNETREQVAGEAPESTGKGGRPASPKYATNPKVLA